MNAVYKLIWNVSTGTWAVAHELATARGKKTSGRSRLAGALAVALSLPAGSALAENEPLLCGFGEQLAADGLRCERPQMGAMSSGIGIMATTDELTRFFKLGGVEAGLSADASTSGVVSVAIGRATSAAYAGTAMGAGAVAGVSGIAIGYKPDSSGNYSIAIGNLATASASESSAFGRGASATAVRSIALGMRAISSGERAISVGDGASASANDSVAMGTGSDANGVNGIAVGVSAASAGNNAVALGRSATAADAEAIALGQSSSASAVRAIAIGNAASAAGVRAIAMGNQTVALSETAVAVGSLAKAYGDSSLAIGRGAETGVLGADGTTVTGGAAAIAMGSAAKALAGNSIALGAGASTTATALNSVALGVGSTATDANTVAVGGTTAASRRRIVNVADGAAANDAATYGQLSATNTSLATLTTTVGGKVDTTFTKVNGETDGDSVASGARSIAIGHGAKAEATRALALGNQAEAKQDTAIAIGSLTKALGDSSIAIGRGAEAGALSEDGSTIIGGRNSLAFGTGAKAIAEGSTALGAGASTAAAASSSIALGSGSTATASNTVSVGNEQNRRRIVNVADGTAANDVATFGQLSSTNTALTTLTNSVNGLAAGTAGLLLRDAASGKLTVAKDADGDELDISASNGKRRLTGLANGKANDEAVTVAQLKAAGALDPTTGEMLAVLTYTDHTLDRANLGGTQGTVIGNLANGLIASGSREAVNGGQLHDVRQALQSRVDALGDRVDALDGGAANTAGMVATTSTSIADAAADVGVMGAMPTEGDDATTIAIAQASDGDAAHDAQPPVNDGSAASPSLAQAPAAPTATTSPTSPASSDAQAQAPGLTGTGEASVAIGGGDASGSGAVAIGEGAVASGSNSVAIGKGSNADRANEFSVGAEGSERVVSNVSAGTRDTDAVNVKQLNDRFEDARDYTDSRVNVLDRRIDRMAAISAAYAGMAQNTAGLSGDNRLGAGVGAQNGRAALAVGYQRILGEKKNVSVSLGGAFSGNEKSVSAGAGMSW